MYLTNLNSQHEPWLCGLSINSFCEASQLPLGFKNMNVKPAPPAILQNLPLRRNKPVTSKVCPSVLLLSRCGTFSASVSNDSWPGQGSLERYFCLRWADSSWQILCTIHTEITLVGIKNACDCSKSQTPSCGKNLWFKHGDIIILLEAPHFATLCCHSWSAIFSEGTTLNTSSQRPLSWPCAAHLASPHCGDRGIPFKIFTDR